MRKLLPVAFIVLCGCSPTYTDYAVDVSSQTVLDRDRKDCLGFAEAYKPGLDLAAIGQGAAQGAGNNAAGALIPPMGVVPALGAAGGASTTLMQQLGLLSAKQLRIYNICLHDRGLRSGAYDNLSPDQ